MTEHDLSWCTLLGVTIASKDRRIALHFQSDQGAWFDIVFWDVIAEGLHRVVGESDPWYVAEYPVDQVLAKHWSDFEAARPSNWPVFDSDGWRTRDDLVNILTERNVRGYLLDSRGHGDRLSGYVLAISMTRVERPRPWRGVE